MKYDAKCNLCGFPRSKHRNEAPGKNEVLIRNFPRWRCPPDFEKGGNIVGDRQFSKILAIKPAESRF